MSTPTTTWLAALPALPPLQGPAGTAERLLLLAHYGIDWSTSWLASYRATYWDRLLPDRVLVATYRSATLPGFWQHLADSLATAPRNPPERLELVQLLSVEPLPVLRVLRTETDPLLLRVRLVADAVRAHRTTNSPTTKPTTKSTSKPTSKKVS